MANFEVLETYNSEIEKLEPTTPGHADVFNAIFQQLINNDAFIKKVAEQQLTIIQSHLNNENEPHQKVFDTYYRQLVNYTDKAIADLINGAPETADTLRELADLIDKNKDVATALNEAIGKKANQTELDQAISDINTLNSGLKNKHCNGVQREHNKKLNNGLPILHKVPPKRDYGRYFCIMAEKGGTSHGGLTEKLSPFFHAKKQEVNAYGR